MNFKKYNFIFVFMVALVVAMPIVSVSTHSRTPSADINDELPPVIEVDTNDQKPSKQNAYKFGNAWQAYNHVLSSTFATSYKMKTVQNLVASANVGVKLDFNQKVMLDTYVTKDGKTLEETYSSGTKEFFNVAYFDGKDVYSQKVDGSFAVGQKPNVTPNKATKADYIKSEGVMPAFTFNLNKNNSSASFFTKTGSKYVFKLTVTDSSVWQDYLKKINIMSGSERYPNMNALSIDFEVSAKTGNLLKMTITEEYGIKYMGIDVTCRSTSVKQFYEVGQNVELPSLSYMGL